MACHSTQPLRCFCGRAYTKPIDLEEHRRARGHFPSHVCKSSCQHPSAGQHNYEAHKCGGCDKVCDRLDILQDHRIATGHCFCSECNTAFESESALDTHRKTKVHASEFRCCNCDLSFKDIHALTAHMASATHRKPLERKSRQKPTKKKKAITAISSDQTCKQCQRTFKSPTALQQHCESLKHKPLSNLACPIGKGCRGKFSAPSALIHHLESGNCESGIDRDDVYHNVQLYDKDRRIHNVPTLTPVSSTSCSTVSASPCLSPVTTSYKTSNEWQLVSTTLSPGSAKWSWVELSTLAGNSLLSIEGRDSDGAAGISVLRCPLCPKKHKGFSTPLALQQHVQSPIHGEQLYHCPTNLRTTGSSGSKKMQKKEKQFTTLGGLAQHIESEACYGGRQTLLYCMNIIQRQLESVGLGGIRLLLSKSQS